MAEHLEHGLSNTHLHVSRMVESWRRRNLPGDLTPAARAHLVQAIWRMIEEARADTRRDCERAIAGRRPRRDGHNLVRRAIETLEASGVLPG